MNAGQLSDQAAENQNTIQIRLNAEHFVWLSRQCEALGVNKQEMIAKALEEWLPRHSSIKLSKWNISVITRLALSDFILRHQESR